MCFYHFFLVDIWNILEGKILSALFEKLIQLGNLIIKSLRDPLARPPKKKNIEPGYQL